MAEALDRPYETRAGRCRATLEGGARCENAAEPGSDYCALPEHQALADLPPAAEPDEVDEAAEEAAAAREAAAIGGAPSSAAADPMAPVDEAGGGQAEGFEEAERQLIQNVEQAPEPELTPDGLVPEDPTSEPGFATDPDLPPDDSADAPGEAGAPAAIDPAVAQPREEEARRATGEPGEADHPRADDGP